VLLVKGAKVSDYNGRSLGVLNSSTVQVNPDIPEAHTLRGWYDQGGNQADIQDISSNQAGGGAGGSGPMTQANWKCLDQIKEEQLGMGDKADYFTSSATIVFAKKENSMYMACSTDSCNKKVIDQNNGTYRCEKCNKDSDTFRWRMILSVE
jgi:replication factor A1